jgi:pyruvate formate lyase activating enzyme
VLQSLVYGRPCSINIDPIEKKPLFHFAPGTRCLSIATMGCNLSCSFCQNWEISHPYRKNIGSLGSGSGGYLGSGIKAQKQDGTGPNEGTDAFTDIDYVDPEAVVEMAMANGLPGIAYTYTEPTIFFEYAYDIMKLARKAGLYNVWVSNGYTSPAPAKKAARYMDAVNVDLKGDVAFYKSLCGVPAGTPALPKRGKQESPEAPMHKALKIYKDAGVWIETTTLIIPGKNDMPVVIEGIVNWVKASLGAETPMHFSRFFPHYKMVAVPPTPVESLDVAADLARSAGMKYVYVGNVSGRSEDTPCPKCGAVVIGRSGYSVRYKRACPKCKAELALAGLKWLDA